MKPFVQDVTEPNVKYLIAFYEARLFINVEQREGQDRWEL